MMEWWIGLTDGQGTLLSGLLTGLGAVIAVLLAGTIFSGRVKSLKEALQEAEELLVEHKLSVDTALTDLDTKIVGVNDQAGLLIRQVRSLNSSFADREESQNEAVEGEEESLKDKFRDEWHRVRDELEDRAASDEIDGRTRAKYGRIDRRQYAYLIDVLEADDQLNDAHHFRNALALWMRFKNGRQVPSDRDFLEMRNFAAEVIDDEAYAK